MKKSLGLINVIREWDGTNQCKSLFAIRPKPEWYKESSDGAVNQENAEKGQDWIKNEDNHSSLECQKKRYKQFLKWVKERLQLNKENYRIPELEVTSPDDGDGSGDGSGEGTGDDETAEGCETFQEWMDSDEAKNDSIWGNDKARREGRFIPFTRCGTQFNTYHTKEEGAEAEGKPASQFQVVYCYECSESTGFKYVKFKNYRLKPVEVEDEVEDCEGFVTFFKGEDDVDICVTTDPRRLKNHLGIEPYDLLASNNQDKIYNLTGRYGNEIYNECITESPYWSGRDTEFKMLTKCIGKYKNKLKQVMGDSSSDAGEDTVAGLAQLLEPINAEVKMCLDMQCIETVSIYRGNVDSYISNEISSWSEGSPERMKSMNKRFGLKKKAIDSWFTPYLEKKLERQVDLKNIPFLDEPVNWPDQNFIDIVENSIALLLTKPSSLRRIRNEGEAYIKVEDASDSLDGTYLIRFNTTSLLPKSIIPIVDTKRKTEFCRKLVTTARQNGFIGTDRNTYLSQVDSLTPKQKVFAEKMRKFVKGYECTTTDPYFILQ